METEYFDSSSLQIRRISTKTAKSFVEKFHYTHNLSLCTISYGLFEISKEKNEWIDIPKESLIGVIVFSNPVGRQAAQSISDEIRETEILELTRLVILDGFGKNIESWFISKSIKMLKENVPHIKCILSYSDTEQNHRGTIYQATNFNYIGLNTDTNLMPNYSISLSGPPEKYKWIHSRTVFSRYGSHNINHLKKKIGRTFWRKKEAGKLKYFLLICDKKTKKSILKSLKKPILPYPKSTEFKEEIEEHRVQNITKENDFFI
jgi:hypothetical protein